MGLSEKVYGICVSVPPEALKELMDAIDGAMEPLYPGYSYCFSVTPSKGYWRTEEGSHPYNGKVGEITEADEMRLRFVCREKDLENVLRTIDRVHPYEEPAVDVIPQIAWRSIIRRPG